jgi:hypothetical protein
MPDLDVAEDRTTDDDLAALLDAMPDATAVLDTDGTIVAVNHAWRMFSVDNGGDPAKTGVGVSYVDVCVRAAAAGCPEAIAVHDCLATVLGGGAIDSELDHPCPSPTVGRWFNLRVTKITGRRDGLLVSHVNISRRKSAEADLERRASHDPLTGWPTAPSSPSSCRRRSHPARPCDSRPTSASSSSTSTASRR